MTCVLQFTGSGGTGTCPTPAQAHCTLYRTYLILLCAYLIGYFELPALNTRNNALPPQQSHDDRPTTSRLLIEGRANLQVITPKQPSLWWAKYTFFVSLATSDIHHFADYLPFWTRYGNIKSQHHHLEQRVHFELFNRVGPPEQHDTSSYLISVNSMF
jgi:hypothetical protein